MSFPKLALGTWLIGGDKEPNPDNDDQKDIATIQLAIDNEISLIDTAQNYAAGRCEELVGQAIANYPRESYKILTKQSKHFLSYDDVIRGCHDSMKRLGVTYLDYFVCHAPNPEFDMPDFFKAANQLHKDGLIKHVGVSNFGPNMLQVALESSDIPIALNQVNFSLGNDDVFSSGTYDFCVSHKIPIQGFRSLADLQTNPDALTILETVAKAHEITVYQATLAYLNSYQNVNFTIKASSKKHWDEIKQALTINLNEEDIQKLRLTHKNKQGVFGKNLSL